MMRMEKGGPVARTAQEVEENGSRLASSTDSLIQDSADQGQLLRSSGTTVARDLNSTATSVDPSHLEHPASFPAFKEPPEPIHVGFEIVGGLPTSAAESRPYASRPASQSSGASPGKQSDMSSSQQSQDSSTGVSSISELRPLAPEAYGGGLYGHDDDASSHAPRNLSSDSQSAEGPPTTTPAHVHAPPSTGDRDLDITGQSYIQ